MALRRPPWAILASALQRWWGTPEDAITPSVAHGVPYRPSATSPLRWGSVGTAPALAFPSDQRERFRGRWQREALTEEVVPRRGGVAPPDLRTPIMLSLQ